MDSDSENSDGEWGRAWNPDCESDPESKSTVSKSLHGHNTEVTVIPGASASSKDKSSMVSRMLLNDNKAGMEGLDKEKINAIIHEASKGSKYYENERKKEAQVNKRVLEQQKKLESFTQEDIRHAQVLADDLLAELEKSRSLSRDIVHIDMDAYYAAVEMRDHPELKDKPMAVGGNDMLSTSNYVARKYGVRAAMPGFIGKKLCPQLIIVPTNFDKYTAVSKQVRAIMAEYDPNFCPMSLDEAYLDMSEHMKRREALSEIDRSFPKVLDDTENCVCRGRAGASTGNDNTSGGGQCSECGVLLSTNKDRIIFGLDVEEAVREMRHCIHLRTRLTASAGIAPNTMLAKVCSDKNKPNGQYRIMPDREEVLKFVKDLPIRKVSGIGKVSDKMLSGLGVVTCADLYTHRGAIYHLYSTISFNYFMRITLGLGSTHVTSDGERKSVSTEQTFSELSQPEQLYSKCEALCQSLTDDLKQEQLLGKTVTLKLKTVQFEVKTRAQTLADYTSDALVVYEAAHKLLKIEIQALNPHPLRLRLMGVRLSNLVKESELGKQRQNTITAFLQKHPSPRKPAISPSKTDASPTKTKKGGILELFGNVSQKPSLTSVESKTELCSDMQGVKTSPIKAKKSGILDLFKNISQKSEAGCNNTSTSTSNITLSINSESNRGRNVLYAPENQNSVSIEKCAGSVMNRAKTRRKSVESVDCPVCQRMIKSSNIKVITEHIEYCLVKQTDAAMSNDACLIETRTENKMEKFASSSLKCQIDVADCENQENLESLDCENQQNYTKLSKLLEHPTDISDFSNENKYSESSTLQNPTGVLEFENRENPELPSMKNSKGVSDGENQAIMLKNKSQNVRNLYSDTILEGPTCVPGVEHAKCNVEDTAVAEANMSHSNSMEQYTTGSSDRINTSHSMVSTVPDTNCRTESAVGTKVCTGMKREGTLVEGYSFSCATTSDGSSVGTVTSDLPHIDGSSTNDCSSANYKSSANPLSNPSAGFSNYSASLSAFAPVGVLPTMSDSSTGTFTGNYSSVNNSISTSTFTHNSSVVASTPSLSAGTIISTSSASLPTGVSLTLNDSSTAIFTSSSAATGSLSACSDTSALSAPTGSSAIQSTSAFQMMEYICPICNVLQDHPTLDSFNKHVDNCLSRQTIKEILSVPKGVLGTNKRGGSVQGAGVVEYPHTQKGLKRSPAPSRGQDGQSNKKRKLGKGLQTLEGFMKARNS